MTRPRSEGNVPLKQGALEKQLTGFFADLEARFGDTPPGPETTPNGQEAPPEEGAKSGPISDPVVDELVRSFLTWEAPRTGVEAAMTKLAAAFVDHNELRVSLPEEVEAMLGARYPLAQERCLRLRSTLNDVFERENGLLLAHLREEPKRSARAYLESLHGVTPFVAARVALLCCEAHAFPVDRVLLDVMTRGGVKFEEDHPDAVSGRLERLVRAGEALPRYARLERAALEKPTSKKRSASRKPSGSKKPASKRAGNAR